jgi:hypothetical protein
MVFPHQPMKFAACVVEHFVSPVMRMIPKKPAPDLIRGGRRFSDQIMRKLNSLGVHLARFVER